MKTQLMKYLFLILTISFSALSTFAQSPPNIGCGTVLNFDGVNDYVSLPLAVGISGNVEFTLEAWVKWDGFGTSTIYAEADTTDNNPMLSIILLPSGGMELTYRDVTLTGLNQSPTNGTVPADIWTHVAVVKTSNTNIKVYINGMLTDDLTFTSPSAWVADVINIGVRERVLKDSYFSGRIDEVRIWNTARTSAEIANNMIVPLMGTEIGLKAYYNFNDNTGSNMLADQVASQNGDLQNMDAATDWTQQDGSIISVTYSSITAAGVDIYTAPSGATYTSSGIYMDTIPNAAGCDSIITIDLSMNFTGLNDFNLNEIHVYPNPTSDKITVSVREAFLGEPIVIFDQTGRIVIEAAANQVVNLLDVSELDNGLYYIRIGKLKAIRFVKTL